MKLLFFILLFFQINSFKFDISKLYPDSIQNIPLYKTINSYFYFDSKNFYSTDNIYLYLEDESFFINYTAICYTNDIPNIYSTINNCNFNTINYYRNSTYKEIFQYFYKLPCKKENEYIIVQYKAKNPWFLKAEISKNDLFDKEQKKDNILIGPIIGVALLSLLNLAIYCFIIPVFCYVIIKSKKNSGNIPNQSSLDNNISNEPLAQSDEISQNNQNQEQTPNDTPIINNEC